MLTDTEHKWIPYWTTSRSRALRSRLRTWRAKESVLWPRRPGGRRLARRRQQMARNNSTIDQIKATQIQMARETQTLNERLNASQEQLAHVVANASEPNVTPEAPKVSPEEPKVMPEIPRPRPRQSANVVQ